MDEISQNEQTALMSEMASSAKLKVFRVTGLPVGVKRRTAAARGARGLRSFMRWKSDLERAGGGQRWQSEIPLAA